MSPALTFTVRRREPVLVGPASPTPREVKRLSDIDDQDTLRMHVPFVLAYRARGGIGDGGGPDPAGAIRSALAEALVHYYPLAGRLREVAERKLVVDCTGEGVVFVEAEADVRLDELEAAGLRPPFPCMEQLLSDVEGSSGVLHCPLLLIQVTRLLCGGFVVALRLNHTICDATGVVQFLAAVSELARGLPAPTTASAWCRELLDARSPPRPSFPHREYDDLPSPPPADDQVMRSFTFGTADIAALRRHLPPRLRDVATTFELLAACLWRCRTAALAPPPGDEMRLVFIVNLRGKLDALRLSPGYYGNAGVPLTVVAPAAALPDASLGAVVEMVREAKAEVTAEYVRSLADFLVLRGRPFLAMTNLFLVSDVRHAGFHRVDFGWGAPVYGGTADASPAVSFFVAVKNGDGEDAVAVPVVLPAPAMERFASEIESLLKAA